MKIIINYLTIKLVIIYNMMIEKRDIMIINQ